jgi:predicted glycogen debranching enzyme
MDALDLSSLDFEGLIQREWLTTSGNGSFAGSTICGRNTRKYHGLLVAAMSPPVRRMVILSRIDETILADGKLYPLSSNEYPGVIHPIGYPNLRAFNNDPFPRWGYQADGFTLEKGLRLIPGQNAVSIQYTLLGGNRPVDLELRPMLALRGMHELSYQWNGPLDAQATSQSQVHIAATSRTPEVFFAHNGRFGAETVWYLNTIYRREQERGYAGLEDLLMPGTFRWTLSPGQTARVVCSTEPVDLQAAIAELEGKPALVSIPSDVSHDIDFADLARAAETFVVKVPQASPPVSVLTHLPWSAPSMRGALISVPGLFLVSGRFDLARELLEGYVPLLNDGLLPSLLPEDGTAPVYHGADVSLWFINAAYQYLCYSGDTEFARRILPALESIIHHYQQGTKLGIGVDSDGLLRSNQPGVPTSWMDAQTVDWIVTPRAGRPVELNALWFNALKAVAEISVRARDASAPAADVLRGAASRAYIAFNRRFWNEHRRCCFDCLEDYGADASVRPNQLLAMSLPFPILSLDRFERVLSVVTAELLVPMGVRTLSPADRAYQGHYGGHVIARDRAYQQGSAYPWLLGPLVTAQVRAYGRGADNLRRVKAWIDGPIKFLHGRGMGQIPELFDGNFPHHPGGALASAPAIAEILRCYSEDILGRRPNPEDLSRTAPAAAAPTKPMVASGGI